MPGTIGISFKKSTQVSFFIKLAILSTFDNHLPVVFYSKVVHEFVKRKDLSHVQQLLINKLKKAFVKASSEGDARMLETIVLTLGSVGKAAEGKCDTNLKTNTVRNNIQVNAIYSNYEW